MEGKQALLTSPLDSPFRYSTFSSLGGLGALHMRSHMAHTSSAHLRQPCWRNLLDDALLEELLKLQEPGGIRCYGSKQQAMLHMSCAVWQQAAGKRWRVWWRT